MNLMFVGSTKLTFLRPILFSVILDIWITKLAPDVIHAGFPCNSFSQAGDRKGFDDPRGESCLIMLNFLSCLEVKPKVLLFEIVLICYR